MRLLSLILLAAACAHAPARTQPAPVAPAAAVEPVRSIRLVAHRPAHYKFVGRVRVTAPNGDFVLAAKQARRKLTQKADALGADVVKIDRVEPELHGHVLLAGRAYRLAD